MADEQHEANIVTPPPPAAALAGEALRIEHARLQALIEHEDAVAKAAEAEASPPRPVDEVLLDFLHTLSDMAGHPPKLFGLLSELHRSYGK